MRTLTNAEIDQLASKPGVRKIAVENFLGNMGTVEHHARKNLKADVRSYEWDDATILAIRAGINMACYKYEAPVVAEERAIIAPDTKNDSRLEEGPAVGRNASLEQAIAQVTIELAGGLGPGHVRMVHGEQVRDACEKLVTRALEIVEDSSAQKLATVVRILQYLEWSKNGKEDATVCPECDAINWKWPYQTHKKGCPMAEVLGSKQAEA